MIELEKYVANSDRIEEEDKIDLPPIINNRRQNTEEDKTDHMDGTKKQKAHV